MGKRSDFPLVPRGFYRTPPEAVKPLVPHLPRTVTAYYEPCAGDGALIDALRDLWPAGRCVWASDVAPQRAGIVSGNALDFGDTLGSRPENVNGMAITNPPWPLPRAGGEPMLSIALHLSDLLPTWLLLGADVMHNRYFAHLAPRCVLIQAVGRVSWQGNGVSGYENAAWYLFDARHRGGIAFSPRRAA